MYEKVSCVRVIRDRTQRRTFLASRLATSPISLPLSLASFDVLPNDEHELLVLFEIFNALTSYFFCLFRSFLPCFNGRSKSASHFLIQLPILKSEKPFPFKREYIKTHVLCHFTYFLCHGFLPGM